MTYSKALSFTKARTVHEKQHLARRQAKKEICKSTSELRTRTVKMAISGRVFRKGVVRRVVVDGTNKSREDLTNGLLKECKMMEKKMRSKFQAILTAHEDERKKLSLLLDDEIAQTLLGIHVRLLALKKEAAEDSATFSNEIVNTQRLIENSANIIKRLSRIIVIQHEI